MSKNNRKTYFINPKFQLKFCLYVCTFVAVCAAAYLNVIWSLLEQISSLTGQSEQWQELKVDTLYFMGFWQVGMFGVIVAISIFISHKIAGPIHKLKMFMSNVREHGNPGELKFRSGDYFTEVADEFNKTMQFISQKQRDDFTYLTEVTSYLNNLVVSLPDDKKNVVNEINRNLTEIQERYLNS